MIIFYFVHGKFSVSVSKENKKKILVDPGGELKIIQIGTLVKVQKCTAVSPRNTAGRFFQIWKKTRGAYSKETLNPGALI